MGGLGEEEDEEEGAKGKRKCRWGTVNGKVNQGEKGCLPVFSGICVCERKKKC